MLVDTKLECLVSLSSAEEYFALSYVWGGTTLLRATSATVDHLREPGSLRRYRDLPQVVRDAMTVVRRLRYRYLWVDSLCIIQDSPDKHAHIASMDIIYAQATVTIVALDGTNASKPLPGVNELSRLPIVNYQRIGDRNFVSEPPYTLDSHLSGSPYQSRGWTLQEWAIPSRLLYFSAQQVIYECDRCVVTTTLDEVPKMTNSAARPRCEYTGLKESSFLAGPSQIGQKLSQLLHGDDLFLSPVEFERVVWRSDNTPDTWLGPPSTSTYTRRRKDLLEAAKATWILRLVPQTNEDDSVPWSEYTMPDILLNLPAPSLYTNQAEEQSNAERERRPRGRSSGSPINKDLDLPHQIPAAKLQPIPPGIRNGEPSPLNLEFGKLDWHPLYVESPSYLTLSLYQEVVQAYTTRQLSYSTDILLAFSGLSAILATTDGSPAFINGLPPKSLTAALLWAGNRELVRRLDKQRRTLLPSYTWAGWDGPVYYPNVLRTRASMMATRIRDHHPSVVSFYGIYRPFQPFIHSTHADPNAGNSHQIFSLSQGSTPCGLLFGTQFPTASSNLPHDHILVAVGSDENKFAELDLAIQYGLRFQRPVIGADRRIYSRRFLFVLMLRRRRDGWFERVAVGKIDAEAFYRDGRCAVRKVHLMDGIKEGGVRDMRGWCKECSRGRSSCVFLT
jgi:Heterokaryon incompatibility protein (HET)